MSNPPSSSQSSIAYEDRGEIPLDDLFWDDKDGSLLLGEGSFGRVVKGYMHGEEVAIKIVRRDREATNDKDREKRLRGAVRQHEREWHRLSQLRFATIVQFYGVARRDCPVRSGCQNGDLMIVTEYMRGGSLNESLIKLRHMDVRLREESFLRIAWQVCNGLRYVHSRELTHGDIKPHNILLTTPVVIRDGYGWFEDDNWKAKLADFGLSMRLKRNIDDTSDTADMGQGAVGTYLYMAPEAYQNHQSLDAAEAKAVDIYALGIVLQEMLTGRQPWVSENVKQMFVLFELVCKKRQRPQWGDLSMIRQEYVDIVNRCLSHDPRNRPTALELSKFFRERFRQARAGGGSSASHPTSASSEHVLSPQETEKIALSVMGREEPELAIIQRVESRLITPRPEDAHNNRAPLPWERRQTLSTQDGTEIDSSALSLSDSTQIASSHSTADDGQSSGPDSNEVTDTMEDGLVPDSVAGFLMRRIDTGVRFDKPTTPGLMLPAVDEQTPPLKGLLRTPQLQLQSKLQTQNKDVQERNEVQGLEDKSHINLQKTVRIEETRNEYQVYIPSATDDRTHRKGIEETAFGASTVGEESSEIRVSPVDDADANGIELALPASEQSPGNFELPGMALGLPQGNGGGLGSFFVAANGEKSNSSPGLDPVDVPGMDIDIKKPSPRKSNEELLASFVDASHRPPQKDQLVSSENKKGSFDASLADFAAAANEGTPTEASEQLEINISNANQPQGGPLASFANAAGLFGGKVDVEEDNSRVDGERADTSATEYASERSPSGFIKARISMFENIGNQGPPTPKRRRSRSLEEKSKFKVQPLAAVPENRHIPKRKFGDILKEQRLHGGKAGYSSAPSSSNSTASKKGSEPKDEESHGEVSSMCTITSPASNEESTQEKRRPKVDDEPQLNALIKRKSRSLTGIMDAAVSGVAAHASLRPAKSRVYRHGPDGEWINEALDSFLVDDLSKVTVSSASSDKTLANYSNSNLLTPRKQSEQDSTNSEEAKVKSDSPVKELSVAAGKSRVSPASIYPSATQAPPPASTCGKRGTPIEKYVSELKSLCEVEGKREDVRRKLLSFPSIAEQEASFTDPTAPPCDCSDTIRNERAGIIEAMADVIGRAAETAIQEGLPEKTLLDKEKSLDNIQVGFMSIGLLLHLAWSHNCGRSMIERLGRRGTWRVVHRGLIGVTSGKVCQAVLSCALAMLARLVSCGKELTDAALGTHRILEMIRSLVLRCLYSYYYRHQEEPSWLDSAYCAVSIIAVAAERSTDTQDCHFVLMLCNEIHGLYGKYHQIYGNHINVICRRLHIAGHKGLSRLEVPLQLHQRRPSAP